VQEVIAEQLDRLPEELSEVLMTVAVAGTSGCREVLSHVHGISRLHAAAVCDALVDRRLLVEDGGLYRCAHPVIAHVVRGGLTAPRRREVHRALALSLHLVTPPDRLPLIAGEIARHADRGEEPELYRSALMASEAALERIAFAEALSWLDLAASTAGDKAEVHEVNRRTRTCWRRRLGRCRGMPGVLPPPAIVVRTSTRRCADERGWRSLGRR
jgi:hypothetical protein